MGVSKRISALFFVRVEISEEEVRSFSRKINQGVKRFSDIIKATKSLSEQKEVRL